jgi:hypothetical protein
MKRLNPFKLLALIATLAFVSACGSDSNSVTESEINRDVNNPGTFAGAQDVVNQMIAQNPCQGGSRINTYFHTSAANYNGFGFTGPLTNGKNEQGSLIKVFVGQSGYNDFLIIREFGNGQIANLYSVQISWCTDQFVVTPNANFSNLQISQLSVDVNIGLTVLPIDYAGIYVNVSNNNGTFYLGPDYGFTVPNYNF